MQYRITVTGISDENIAITLARMLDNNGQAFKAFIDIVVETEGGPVHASPVWSNRQVQECESCGGSGKVGSSDDPDECLACLGSGEVDAR